MFWYWHSIDPVMHGQAKVECGILRKGKLCLKCKRSKFKTQGNVEEIQGCRMTLDSHVTMKLKQVLPLSFPDSTLRGSALRTVPGNTCELQLPFYMNWGFFFFYCVAIAQPHWTFFSHEFSLHIIFTDLLVPVHILPDRWYLLVYKLYCSIIRDTKLQKYR